MPTVELVGGPLDGEVRQVPEDGLFGRLEFVERDRRPESPLERLRRGERVPAVELEAGGIVHTYSRSEPAEMRDGARVYRYVRPA